MRILLAGQPPLTPAVADALLRHGHQPVTPDSIGLTPESPKDQIIRQAEESQLDILTADPDLIEAPYQQDLWFKRTIIFLQLKGGDVEHDDAIDRLFTRYKRLNPRHLYTVTETRVKTRQLPGAR